MNRLKVMVNGFEYWFDTQTNILYETENAQNGTYIYSKHITKNEREQIFNFVKFINN